jgi:hypothetical protein
MCDPGQSMIEMLHMSDVSRVLSLLERESSWLAVLKQLHVREWKQDEPRLGLAETRPQLGGLGAAVRRTTVSSTRSPVFGLVACEASQAQGGQQTAMPSPWAER